MDTTENATTPEQTVAPNTPPAQNTPPTAPAAGQTNAPAADAKPPLTHEEVEKLITDARARWDTEQQVKERLAKLAPDARAAEEQRLKEESFAKREGEILRRELLADAVDTLTQKGLPKTLADILDLSSADNYKKSIESVEKAFTEAVTNAVEQKLRGKTPEGLRGMTGSDNIRESAAKAIRGGF